MAVTESTRARTQTRNVQVDSKSTYTFQNIPLDPDGNESTQIGPTVVFVAGIGSTERTWLGMHDRLSGYRTFAYDRLGLGSSESTDKERSAETLAIELKETLYAAKVPGPYVLVAHSYAGIIVREFLEQFNEDVAGMVLIDANQEMSHVRRRWPVEAFSRCVDKIWTTDDSTELAQEHRLSEIEWDMVVQAEKLEKEKRKDRPPTASEGASYVSSLDHLGTYKQLERQALGDRPLRIIVANLARDVRQSVEASGKGTQEDRRVMLEYCDELPAIELGLAEEVKGLSSRASLVVDETSGHLVPWWNPDLCAEEIRACVEECRGGRP